MSGTKESETMQSGLNKNRIIVIVIVAVVAVAVCLILLLPKQTEEIPTFVVWHSFPEGSAQAQYIERTVLPALESQYDGIKMGAVYYDENEIYDQALRARNEGMPPDVVFMTRDSMAGLAQLGALEAFAGEGVDVDFHAFIETLLDEPISAGMIGGKAYGLPMDASVQVLLYNPDILSGAGISTPSGIDAFWAALETLSPTIPTDEADENADEDIDSEANEDTSEDTDSEANEEAISDMGSEAIADSIPGFVLPDAGMKSLAPFVWSTGGELVNEEGTRAYGYLNNSKNIAVFDRFAAALERGQIVVAEDEETSLAMFASGGAAMTVIDTASLDGFAAKYPEAVFEIVAFPAGAAGSVSVMDCKFVSVAIEARKDIAAEFLSEIMSADAMKTESSSYIPEGALASARFLPMSYSIKDMGNEFVLAMKRITEGYMDTEEALDDLALKWDAYL